MRRLLPFVLLALTIAVGVALAPYVLWLVAVAVALSALWLLAAGFEMLRRELVADLTAPTAPAWYNALQDRLDPLRSRVPVWVFGWRGALVFLAPLWLTVLALTVLPFVMR